MRIDGFLLVTTPKCSNIGHKWGVGHGKKQPYERGVLDESYTTPSIDCFEFKMIIYAICLSLKRPNAAKACKTRASHQNVFLHFAKSNDNWSSAHQAGSDGTKSVDYQIKEYFQQSHRVFMGGSPVSFFTV